MAHTRIVIIGGGGYKTAPKLLGDILLTKSLNGSTIVLQDTSQDALNTMQKLAAKMVKKAHSQCKILTTRNREEALNNAHFVIIAINVGGFEALKNDVEIPLNFGIYQTRADCVGPGGISRALRTIPVFIDIVKDMERICPDAWLVNFTDPIPTLCRLVNKTSSIKVFGIGNELAGTVSWLKQILHTKQNPVINLQIGGINRLGWILDLKINREDGFSELRKYIKNEAKQNRKGGGNKGNGQHAIRFELFNTFGYLPYGDDHGIAEFFPYFLTADTRKGERYGVRPVNLKKVRSEHQARKEKIERAANSRNPVNFQKSGSELADIIDTLASRKEGTFIMNIPNRGSLSNLPLDAVVEMSCYIKNHRISEPVIEDLPHGLLGIIVPQVIVQELIMEASLKGSRKIALQALLLDPLVKNFGTAEKMLDQLLKAHRNMLPQFYG